MTDLASKEDERPPLNVDQEIDLLEYLHAILRAKFRILLACVVVAGLVFGFSKTLEDRFKSTVLVAINIGEGFGGTKPGQYRGSDIVGLLEYSFMVDEPADNEQDRLMARLSSTGFIELFISEQNLLPYVFKESWDDQEGEWIEGFEPSMSAAVGIFREKMLSANIDTLTGLLPISITTNDREFSAKLANEYSQRFNRYIREKRLEELKKQGALLDARLDATTNIEMQRSIFRMLETQLAEEILLTAKDNYPLEVIQEAQPPLYKSSPNRKLWTILAFVITAVISISICISVIIFRKLRLALNGYDVIVPKDPLAASSEQSKRSMSVNREPQARAEMSSSKKAGTHLDDLNEWLD